MRIFRFRTAPKDEHVKIFRARNLPKSLHVTAWRRHRNAQKSLHVRLREAHLAKAFRDRFPKRDDAKRAAEHARKAISHHELRESPVRSFRFAKPIEGRPGSYEGHYAFTMTWTPGHVTLAGDLGEVTLSHYHALASFESGMGWLEGGSFDYLAGKSDLKRVFDRDETLREIVLQANEPALRAVREATLEARRYRADLANALADMRRDRAAWRALGPSRGRARRPLGRGPRPRASDYGIDAFDYVGIAMRATPREDRHRQRWHGHHHEDRRRHDVPDGFETWYDLWRELVDDENPDAIFRAHGRREIVQALDERLSEGGPENCATLLMRMGFSDWYGTEVYTHHARLQVEALQFGARAILASLKGGAQPAKPAPATPPDAAPPLAERPGALARLVGALKPYLPSRIGAKFDVADQGA